MRVGIFPNIKRPESLLICEKVNTKLMDLGIKTFVPDKYPDLNAVGATHIKTEDIPKECDILIAVGGDGTFIRCAKLAAPCGKPVLGINAGRVGYLATLEPDKIDDLDRLLSGKYSLQKRIMLKIAHNGKIYYALNDAVISRGPQSVLLDLELSFNNHLIDYRADGIIVATPTGSTAYSLSAGGPVLEPDINNLIISPICPYSLFSRSLVVSGDSVINIATARDNQDAFLCVDGSEPKPLANGESVKISRAEFYANVIDFEGLSFYDVLSNKLR